MKITKTVIAPKSAVVKAPTKTAATTVAKTAAKVVKSAKAAGTSGFHQVKNIETAIVQYGIDGATAWLGKHVEPKLVTLLVAKTDELKKAKLAKPGDKVLVVNARKLFAWPLVGVSGDVYARKHSPKAEVRGSLSLLRKFYGESKVKLVSVKDALAMTAKIKTDAGCQKALDALVA